MQRADQNATVEVVGGTGSDSASRLEWISASRIDATAVAEWIGASHADAGALALEVINKAVADATGQSEVLASQFNDNANPVEILSAVIVQIVDALLPFELGLNGSFVLPSGTTFRFIANVGSLMRH